MLDSIQDRSGAVHKKLGGPPCYCGLTARRFGFEVELVTRVGKNFPEASRQLLTNNKIAIRDNHTVDAATTEFFLDYSRGEESRAMVLNSKCLPVVINDIKGLGVDCWLVSPVTDEVPFEVLKAVKNDGGRKKFVMLDPQGYMRFFGEDGRVGLKDRLELDLQGISAVKVDPIELAALTGGESGLRGMQALQEMGIEFVVYTEPYTIHLLHKKVHYWVKLGRVDAPDSTGAGDILDAAFCCAYIKEKDPLWALCFGAGALRAALETKSTGLDKIPSWSKIEQSASYYYGTVEFKQL